VSEDGSTARGKWGKPNARDWVHRPSLATIENTERGGKYHACAAKLKDACPANRNVDNRQLKRWANANKPWTCWIPKALVAAFDDYDTNHIRPPPKPPKSAAGSKASPPPAASVVFAPADQSPDPILRDPAFGEAWLFEGNNEATAPGEPAQIRCTVILRCKAVGSKRWIGVANAQLHVASTSGFWHRPFAGKSETWSHAGATFHRVGGGRYIAVDISSGGAQPLLLDALNRSGDHDPTLISVGDFEAPKPGEGVVVTLRASFQNGFVIGAGPRPTAASPAGGSAKIQFVGNRDKVLKHCALLAAGLPPDAEEVDLSVVVRRFAAEQS